MEKEKLEEAKRLYQTANADQRYVLERLFPALAESEDERIRKAIIEHFTGLHSSVYPYKGFTKEQILAWLENQGKSSLQWKRIKKGEHLPEKSVVMTEDGTILPFGTEGGIEVGQDAYYLPIRELSTLPKQNDKL